MTTQDRERVVSRDKARGAGGPYELKASYDRPRNEGLVVEPGRNAAKQPVMVIRDEDRPMHESRN